MVEAVLTPAGTYQGREREDGRKNGVTAGFYPCHPQLVLAFALVMGHCHPHTSLQGQLPPSRSNDPHSNLPNLPH